MGEVRQGGREGVERGAIWRRAEAGAPGVNAPWRDVFQRSGGAGGRTERRARSDAPALARAQKER